MPTFSVQPLADPAGVALDVDSVTRKAVHVAGWVVSAGSVPGAGQSRAVRWDAAGTGTLLDPPAGSTGQNLNAVMADGTAFGTASQPGGTFAPVRWSPSGSPTLYAVPAGYASAAHYGVNELGVTVGSAFNAGSSVPRATRWSADGTPTIFGDAGSSPQQINRSGVSVGTTGFGSAGGPSAARWAADGALGVIGGASSYGVDVNDAGVALTYGLVSGTSLSRVWTVGLDGASVELFAPVGLTLATAPVGGIDDAGRVIGTARAVGNGPRDAVLCDADGTASRLDDALVSADDGWTIFAAFDIDSNAALVRVSAFGQNPAYLGGTPVPLLLTASVPEPGAALALLGVAALTLHRHARRHLP